MATSSITLGLAHDIARMATSEANLNPTSGPVGLLFSIVLSLFNTRQNYNQEFRDINNKIDAIEMQLEDLSSLIANIAAADIYFDSSTDIYYQMRKLMKYMQSNSLTKNITRNEFFTAYETSGEDQPIWILSKNLQYLLNTFAQTSNYNKTYVTNAGKMLMESMMMGISCSYSYEFLKNRNYDEVLRRWKGEIDKLKDLITDYEKKCVQMARESAENVIRRSLSHYGTSNQQQFTNRLYQLLTSTYDWLSWMVIVYDGNVESSFDVFKCCDGIYVKGKKNVVTFYVNKQQKPIASINAVNKALGKFFRPRVIARRLYNFLRDYGVTGPIFVCKLKYGVTIEYDKSYGITATSGRLFMAKFGS